MAAAAAVRPSLPPFLRFVKMTLQFLMCVLQIAEMQHIFW